MNQIELPDFVVISGLMGSGKTHLLEGIFESNILIKSNGKTIQKKKLVNTESFLLTNSIKVDNTKINVFCNSSYGIFDRYIQGKKNNPNLKIEDINKNPINLEIIKLIAENIDKEIDDLNESDFYDYYPIHGELINRDIFYQSLSIIFKRYHKNQEQNKINKYYSRKEHKEKNYLTDEKFKKRFGEPPWIIVNKILKEANLDYKVNSPENQNIDSPFQLKLINTINGANINFEELSSGEKVIMSICLALYNSNYEVDIPELILMDEPDASLHPSMVKRFFDVVENLFVKEKGIKVIITTHSPSTIALAPDNSLFIMNKRGNRIENVSKDKALRNLLSGVPSISIDYENRRQVFVESSIDVMFYDKIFDRLSDYFIPEISITFISSGIKGKGNCDQVKDIVKRLRKGGVKTIFGIIDWDAKNNGNENVKVLGKNKRYNLENYIFDPILLAAFLLHEKIIKRQIIGLKENENYTEFKNFDIDKLQKIANFIINKLISKFDNEVNESEIKIVEYINSKKIKLPKWFLTMNGHKLEEIIKEAFPKLKKFKKKNELKQIIIKTVIDDVPEIMSRDIVELIKSIQE